MRFHELKFFDESKEALVAKDNIIERPYDGSRLVNLKPASTTISFTGQNSENVTWNDAGSTATFTHTLNCRPDVHVYNSEGMQVYPDIQVLSGTSFALYFEASSPLEDETWLCAITYSSEYGSGGDVTTEIGSALSQAQTCRDQAEGYRNQMQAMYGELNGIIEGRVASTLIRVETGATVSITTDEVVRYTPASDGAVTITATDALHYGSCIMFITLGASNAITFSHAGSAVTPLDALVANKTNQCVIEIIGNGIANDIKITVVRTW